MSSPVNIICMKWGTRYPSHYVNVLFRSVERNLSLPFRFICITDDTEGLLEGIETTPFPENPGLVTSKWPNVFMKPLMTRDGYLGLEGPTLFLDLDLVILDSIDCFFEYKPGKNCIIHNWWERRKQIFGKRPEIGNSSIFRFEAGSSNYIYETFVNDIPRAEDRSQFVTEQAFLTFAMEERYWWPQEWVSSFKFNVRPPFPLNLVMTPQKPRGAKFLVFHGRPDPDNAVEGFPGKKMHHRVKPAPWVADYWKL